MESYQNLVENLEGYGYNLEGLPLVFQYNKRDLSDISSAEELESTLNPKGLPHFEAVATKGIGVFDTLKCISKLVLDLAKGKKVVPEREVSVKEAILAQSQPPQPEGVTDLEHLEIPASVSLSPERLEFLSKKESETTPQEKILSPSKKWPGSSQHQTEYQPPLTEKKEKFEPEKSEMVSEGLSYGQQEREVEGGGSVPKTEESPTIISWSAAREKKESEPKGFFLWRFFKKLLNR